MTTTHQQYELTCPRCGQTRPFYTSHVCPADMTGVNNSNSAWAKSQARIAELESQVRDLTGEREQSRKHYLALLDVLWPKDRGFIPISGEYILTQAAPQLRKDADEASGLRDNVERLKEEFAHTLKCFRLACERLEITKAESRDFAGIIERMEPQLVGMRGA